MKISITQTHINLALELCKKGSHRATSCPIALALKERLGIPWLVVSHDTLYTHTDRFELPSSAVEFQKRFDADRQVYPFEFEIADADRQDKGDYCYFRPLHRLVIAQLKESAK